MEKACFSERKDWVGTPGAFALGWGLPGLGLVAAMFLDSSAKAILWSAALVWMGIACLANAARCRRMHCHFTGPFFLLMALLSLLHGFGIVRLGPQGWTWIGLTVGGGGAVLWWVSEHVWGKFAGWGSNETLACGTDNQVDRKEVQNDGK